MTCRFTIYCHTNRVNGKRYVGQTTYSMEKRWGDHVSAAKGKKEGSTVFVRAIRKYGADAFDHQILETVSTQEESDLSESRWIESLNCRSPLGYNLKSGGGSRGRIHEDTKILIGEASRAWWSKLTPEERSARQRGCWSPERVIRAKSFSVSKETRDKIGEANRRILREMPPEQLEERIKRLRSNPEKRLARLREANSTEEFRKNVREGQKKFWAQLPPEEKTRRVKHQQSGMSQEAKSDRIRKAWAKMSPEARAARVRKAAEGVTVSKANPAHIKKMSEWQTEQAKRRTPEQRQAMVLKSWETRRAKYGKKGHSKSSEVFSAATRKGWANMTPEARIERGRKIKEGRRLAREARAPQLIRINLFSPAIQ